MGARIPFTCGVDGAIMYERQATSNSTSSNCSNAFSMLGEHGDGGRGNDSFDRLGNGNVEQASGCVGFMVACAQNRCIPKVALGSGACHSGGMHAAVDWICGFTVYRSTATYLSQQKLHAMGYGLEYCW